jgi:hypothetical protein
MMRWIVGSSLKFRLLVLAAAEATIAVGISRLRGIAQRGAWGWHMTVEGGLRQ